MYTSEIYLNLYNNAMSRFAKINYVNLFITVLSSNSIIIIIINAYKINYKEYVH